MHSLHCSLIYMPSLLFHALILFSNNVFVWRLPVNYFILLREWWILFLMNRDWALLVRNMSDSFCDIFVSCYNKNLDYIFPVISGTALKRSATNPKSATWNIGASGSLFMATIVLESFIPAKCWIAPEIPTAM